MRILMLTSSLIMAFIATAHAQSNPPIDIGHAWARATAASTANGAVYLTITNHGASNDRLMGATTLAASKAELNVTINDNGIMKMRPITDLPVKAGGSAEFKPGGTHIMLLGLKQPLQAGKSFPMTLKFEKAGAIETTVTVEKAGASAPDGMPGMKDMPGMK